MIIILGAGITGTAVAYYLASSSNKESSLSFPQQQLEITIIDSIGPATGSSGKAGAFLSETSWNSDKAQILHSESFKLHEQLSKELKLNSWHELEGQFVTTSSTKDRGSGKTTKPIPGRCAQVDPKELTNALLDGAIQKLGHDRIKLEIDTVENVQTTTTGSGGDENDLMVVESIKLQSGKILDVDVNDIVVIALGPWSSRIEDWFEIPIPIDGVLSTSMIWNHQQQRNMDDEDSTTIPHSSDYYFESLFNDNGNISTALFSDGQDDQYGCHLEIIPRKDKSTYVSGCGNSQIINPAQIRGPERPIPGDEQPDHSRIKSVRQSIQNLFSNLDDGDDGSRGGSPQMPVLPSPPPPPSKIQACIRPNSPDGIPIVGKILDNCYVATGGGPWGITYGPIMGQQIANEILQSTTNSIIRPSLWHPRRFDTLVYKLLMKQRQKEAWGGE